MPRFITGARQIVSRVLMGPAPPENYAPYPPPPVQPAPLPGTYQPVAASMNQPPPYEYTMGQGYSQPVIYQNAANYGYPAANPAASGSYPQYPGTAGGGNRAASGSYPGYPGTYVYQPTITAQPQAMPTSTNAHRQHGGRCLILCAREFTRLCVQMLPCMEARAYRAQPKGPVVVVETTQNMAPFFPPNFVIPDVVNGFVTKVCLLHMVQTAFTLGLVSIACFEKHTRTFLDDRMFIKITAGLLLLFTYIFFLLWDTDRRQRAPGMYSSLVSLTLIEGFFFATLTGISTILLWTAGMIVSVNITLACISGSLKTSIFSFGQGVLGTLLTLLVVCITAFVVVLVVPIGDAYLLAISTVIAFLYTMDEVVCLALMLEGDRGVDVTPENHWYGALQLKVHMLCCIVCNIVFFMGKLVDLCC